MSEAVALRQTGATSLRSGDPGRIGPYEPLALLGSGGMGRVFLARAAEGGAGLVAVKVIRPEYADDPDFRRRFEREASVHSRVRTPHAPRLCGTGFQDELLWMATEYLPAVDLADAVRQGGALESAAVWRLVAELGRALTDLADAGIVHRDLKPSNVLLSARATHLIDFGLSKAVDASALTGTGNRVGTPAYMSPEHLRTGTCTTASDVFSLAGTLVYAAGGRAPFGDGTGVDVMHRVAFEEPNPQLLGDIHAVDPELGALLSACLDKEPERRPAPRDLVDAAVGRAGVSDWPEPLMGQVLARQEAYEVLCRVPVVRDTGLPSLSLSPSPSAGGRPEGEPAAAEESAAPEDVRRPARPTAPAPPALVASAGVGGSSGVTSSPEQPVGGGLRGWGRKRPAMAVAVGVTVCAVAAGALVFTRQDAPADALSPGAGVATGDAAPGGVPRSPGTSVDGAASVDGGAERPEDSGSPDSGRRTAPGSSASASASASAAAAEPDAPGAGVPSASGSTSAAAAPDWVSDCTYYAGSGRTRQGDSGKRVFQVQCMLTKRGYDLGGGVDGEFGPGTESAVRSFQSDKGLGADGIVGPQTWSALRDTV
jgi:eukaryotic-like serine/threonine-protein kinase